jgi:hypothetical protein
VQADAFHPRRECVIVGEDRAAVAIAAERLRRKEARRGRGAEGPELVAAIGRAEALRRVVEDCQIVFLGNCRDRFMIGRQAEQIDRNDRTRR